MEEAITPQEVFTAVGQSFKKLGISVLFSGSMKQHLSACRISELPRENHPSG
jgi:hypothetical protein